MIPTLLPDVLISLNQRRRACVLDPTLALSDYGLALVKQLGELMELWVVREFWHMIDNTQFYCQQPEFILETSAIEASSPLSPQVVRVLKEWERLRNTTDRNHWNVHFLADVLGESYLPNGTDPGIIQRWESLAQSLDNRLEQPLTHIAPLTLAIRDLTALAAACPAYILTYRSSPTPTPHLCTILEKWQIPCREIPLTDSLAAVEREQFRQLLVHAGLAKLLWSGLDLILVHLMVPRAATLSSGVDWADDLSFSDLANFADEVQVEPDLWEGARGFWYSLTQ